MSNSASTGAKPNIRLALIPLLSTVGASASIYLSKHYYDLRAGTAAFKSLCNISTTLNCDAVATSRFAEILPGLPLSSFVAGWFVALLILSLIARVGDLRREAMIVSTLMSGFATVYSIALLAVMFFVLKRFCLYCLVIDGVNFALFGICLSLLNRDRTTSIFGGARWSKIQSNALLVVGILFVTVVLLRPSQENVSQASKSELNYAVAQALGRPSIEIKTPIGAAVLGNPNAAITIHEFSDFQCPFCRRGALIMNQLLSRYDGKLKVVFMPFPLDNACNRMITRAMHAHACALARSAYCAGKEGKFQAVYEKIFDDQEFLTADSAKKIPAEFGVGAEMHQTCMNSEDAKKALSESIEEGIRLKIESTPTFFINGKRVDGSLPMEAWDEIIAGLK